MILNAEDQNNEFKIPYENPCLIWFNRIVKDFRLQQNMEFSLPFMRSRTFCHIYSILNHFGELVKIHLIWFLT